MNLRSWSLRARAMFARRHVERELDEELAFHIDREVQKLIDEGVPEADARVAARRRFGSVPRAADECRDARGVSAIDNIVRDTRYALRGLRARATGRRSPSSRRSASGSGWWPRRSRSSARSCSVSIACPDIHEMFAVEHARTGDDPSPPFTRSQFDALARDTRRLHRASTRSTRRRRQPGRRPDDDRVARHRQLLPGTRCPRRDRPFARRRATTSGWQDDR